MNREKLFNCAVYSLEGLTGSIPVTDRNGKVQKVHLGEKVILSESCINNLRNCTYTDYVAKIDEVTKQLKSVPIIAKRFLIETFSEVKLEPDEVGEVTEEVEKETEKRVGRPRKE